MCAQLEQGETSGSNTTQINKSSTTHNSKRVGSSTAHGSTWEAAQHILQATAQNTAARVWEADLLVVDGVGRLQRRSGAAAAGREERREWMGGDEKM